MADQGLTPERVAELAQAEENGWLLVLPCKVGDTVYVVCGTDYAPYVVDRIHILANCEVQVRLRDVCWRYISYLPASAFGKTAFLTVEEADAVVGRNRRDLHG